MYKVYCEEQFIGEFVTYEEAVNKATEDGKTGANFIGCLEIDNKEIYTYVYNTPDGDEVLNFYNNPSLMGIKQLKLCYMT